MKEKTIMLILILETISEFFCIILGSYFICITMIINIPILSSLLFLLGLIVFIMGLMGFYFNRGLANKYFGRKIKFQSRV